MKTQTRNESARRGRILPQRFYARDPRIVARELLGKVLVRTLSDRVPELAGRIVEVEAYLGQDDEAAHSAAGETARNRVLFGPPGHAYIYFIYGVHFCLNFSCLPAGQAGCVLLRALEPLSGIEEMARARRINSVRLQSPSGRKLLTSGPGRLCEALSITRSALNGAALYLPDSGLRIVEDAFQPMEIGESPRVGITKSSALPLRYFIAGNKFVSR